MHPENFSRSRYEQFSSQVFSLNLVEAIVVIIYCKFIIEIYVSIFILIL